MPVSIYQVDAFTGRPFAGNPAGVCLLPSPASEIWMKHVAAEMNLSETAFLSPLEDGYGLRWFTPAAEVDLCGHATLASAHILFERGFLPAGETARFHTRSGLLTASLRGEWIQMDFPATPCTPAEPPAGLLEALGTRALYVGRSVFDYLIEVESEEVVRNLHPDIRRLDALPVRGTIVTSRAASPDFDFVSRFFAPAVGVDEDPVPAPPTAPWPPFGVQSLVRTNSAPARPLRAAECCR